MRSRNRCDERVVIHPLGSQPVIGVSGQAVKDAEVDTTVAEGLRLLDGIHLEERDADVRQVHSKEAEDVGENASVGCRFDEADPKSPDLSTCSALRSPLRSLGLRERLPRFRQECSPGRRELDATRNALEEWCPDFALQVANLPAQRRLCDVEAAGRPPEVKLLRDRDEVTKVSQLHDPTPFVLNGDERKRTPKTYWVSTPINDVLDEDGRTRLHSSMKHFLLVSDFDQTLSFNDSGRLLSELLGIGGFEERVAGLSRLNLVQEGAELTYLLRHDPEYRRVRRDDLIEVGKRIRLKQNIGVLAQLLSNGIDGHRFDMYVVSAAPEEVVHSALDGLIPQARVRGTQFTYSASSGEIESIVRVSAGYGKVAAVNELRIGLGVPRDRVVYVGDGSSDLHVMLHVNRGDGLTIAVSQDKSISEIAKRTVVSDDALGVLVPVLEEIVGFGAPEIRALFDRHGFVIQEWEKVRTDWLTIREHSRDELRPIVAVA